MSTSIISADAYGLLVKVECKITSGLPNVQIVGMASKSIEESKERVRAAFASSGITFPKKRVLVSLSPSDVQKEGSSFDLPIALAILLEAQMIPATHKIIFAVGELGLDGSILPVRGVIGRLLSLVRSGLSDVCICIPKDNEDQASLVAHMTSYVASHLVKTMGSLCGTVPFEKATSQNTAAALDGNTAFAEVQGQAKAKRALEIAAAGKHNILLYGPPGTGKTMLSKALQSILPPLEPSEMLETNHLHSLTTRPKTSIITEPPLRSPHHSASEIAIIGGGNTIRPGEISLAHNGILFFDELPEFSRSCLEALRQPLEENVVHIARAHQSVSYPAAFIFVATMNPCPCGQLGSSTACSCSPHSIQLYQKRLSGPILDRIDLFVYVDLVKHEQLLKKHDDQVLQAARTRIKAARIAQMNRNSSVLTNGKLTTTAVKKLAIEPDAVTLLNTAAERMKLSPRAYFKVMRVARTIADLDGTSTITKNAIAEALQYREKLPEL